MADFEDQVELPVDGLELTTEEISFNDNGTVNDAVYVEEVAAPEVSAVVVEEELVPVMTEEVVEVEETVPAPVAVIEEPEPTYVAPIEEPVHHVRWPWALLALPLLAIPFIPRHHEEPVAEPARVVQTPVVVETPVVRPTAPAARAVRPAPVPECAGTWTTSGSVVLRMTASDAGSAVSTLASGTAVDVKSAEAGWYKVAAGADNGYLPINVVVCTVDAPAPMPAATTTVTG
jgi:uncharacterized protein YgiM (DUF1202 family)